MKFPITRKALQIFDPIQEERAKRTNDIQNCLNSTVQKICQEIEKRMAWTYNSTDIYNFNRKKEAHDKIMKDKRFVWEGLRYALNTDFNEYSDVTETIIIPVLIQKLQETFIGCDIVIDPLRTYVILDWSL